MEDHAADPMPENGEFGRRLAGASGTGLMTPRSASAADWHPGQKPSSKHDRRFVRLSVNLSTETDEIFKSLIDRKGLSISEGIRRAIAVWKFFEDEEARGNEIAVTEPEGGVRKVVIL